MTTTSNHRPGYSEVFPHFKPVWKVPIRTKIRLWFVKAQMLEDGTRLKLYRGRWYVDRPRSFSSLWGN